MSELKKSKQSKVSKPPTGYAIYRALSARTCRVRLGRVQETMLLRSMPESSATRSCSLLPNQGGASAALMEPPLAGTCIAQLCWPGEKVWHRSPPVRVIRGSDPYC